MFTDITDAAVDRPRRRLLGAAAMSAAAAALFAGAPARSETAAPRAPASVPASSAFRALKRVRAGDLDVSYAEDGPPDGPPVILLHGWPYDIHSFAEATPRLAAAGYRVIVPYLRGYGSTRFVSADAPRNAQPAAMAADVVALMDALAIPSAILAGFDWGARTANIAATLWPERVRAMVSVSGYLIGAAEAAATPLAPEAEHRWWYQFYFATERGRAGYARQTDDFARLIWRLASPTWAFDDATFARTAAAFANPDHCEIVIHNYRWRLGLADGERRFDALERRLAETPTIATPTVTLEGDANGAPHPEPASYAGRFTGKYAHHLVTGGVGHNLPQEAPEAFVGAIVEADGLAA
ncbi:MAG: alpha/beta hydrolase [Pseudomonadota bacterium]|nr:alpha/beta hydrolase [Pseudomonadota bacterium]